MFCPGPWLRPGRNEIVLLDLLNNGTPTLAGLDQPILNQLHPEKDFSATRRAGGKFSTDSIAPIHRGTFSDEVQWQEVKFQQTGRGRYLCLEAVSSFDGTPVATVAELDAFGPDGRALSKTDWRVLWVDSENAIGSGGEADNVLDGQPASFWKTEDWDKKPGYPHRIVIDLGESSELAGIRYLPRAANFVGVGHIKDFAIYLHDQPFGLTPSP
jgi:beta-galactosidase